MFAGTWDHGNTTGQGSVDRFTLITQTAGASLNGYRDRAPVVLFGNEWASPAFRVAPKYRSDHIDSKKGGAQAPPFFSCCDRLGERANLCTFDRAAERDTSRAETNEHQRP